MRYLKNDQYYIDRYDIHTIEECLDWYWRMRKGFEKERQNGAMSELSKPDFDKEVHKVCSYLVNVIKAERYKRKKETIQDRMERDKREQEKLDNAVAPRSVLCKECFSPTKVISKDLFDSYKEDGQVLFMFECLKCGKRRSVYEDGNEWHYEPPNCPNCNSALSNTTKHSKNLLVTVYSCLTCSYKKEDIYDSDKSKKEREARELKEKKLLTEYREQFCVDEKTGEEMLRTYEHMSKFTKELEDREKKNKDPLIQKARLLKKLTVAQLLVLIEKVTEIEGYKDLKFGKAEMGKYVIIEFSINETNDSREEYASKNILKKIISVALANTNWRLMAEGVHYRLGILTGKLKAYEQEEDLVKLVNL